MRYEFADCVLDVDRHELLRGGRPIPVEPQVFDLLVLLAENPGKLTTREQIIDRVWNGRFVSDSTVSARIAAARKAVGDDGKTQRVIKTIVRRGLQMTAAVDLCGTPTDHSAYPTQQLRYVQGSARRAIPFTLSGEGLPVLRIGSVVLDLEAEWQLPSERTRLMDLTNRFRLLCYSENYRTNADISDQKEREDMLEEVLAVTEAAGFEKFAIVGEFSGAFPALEFATRYPDRVEKLVIAGGWAEGRDHRTEACEPDSIRTLIAEGWHTPRGGFAMSSMLSYFPEGPLEDVRAMVEEMQALYSIEQKLRYRDNGNRISAMHLLPQVRCPTLIIHGRHATVHPLSEARKLAAGIPNASLEVLETGNQIPLPGNSAYPVYLQAIRSFLEPPA